MDLRLSTEGGTLLRLWDNRMWSAGGAEGTRTPDLLRAKEALSQLSYSPIYKNYYSNKGSHSQFAPTASHELEEDRANKHFLGKPTCFIYQ